MNFDTQIQSDELEENFMEFNESMSYAPDVYVHKYCVEFWEQCDDKMCIERGIVFGSTFSEVVRRLEVYYGEKNIESIRELTGFDIGGEYVMPECAFEELGYKLNIKECD